MTTFYTTVCITQVIEHSDIHKSVIISSEQSQIHCELEQKARDYQTLIQDKVKDLHKLTRLPPIDKTILW